MQSILAFLEKHWIKLAIFGVLLDLMPIVELTIKILLHNLHNSLPLFVFTNTFSALFVECSIVLYVLAFIGFGSRVTNLLQLKSNQ